MGSKVWLVCEDGWQYDDNNYYNGGEGSGSPIKGYRSEGKARAAAAAKNFDRIRELIENQEIMEYLHEDGWDALFSHEAGPELHRLLIKHGVTTTDDYRTYYLPEDGLPEEFWIKLLDLEPAQLFYTVTSVYMAESE